MYDWNFESLKIGEQYFTALIEGRKPFEVRKNDRNYKPGDKYCLREYLGANYVEPCEHYSHLNCEGWREIEDTPEYGEVEAIDACGRNRSRCGEYIREKYTGRTVIIQIKEVFRLPGEIADYVAFTFDILKLKLDGKPFSEVVDA